MGTASVCIEVNRDPELEAVAELLDVEGVIDEAGGVGFATPEPIGGAVVTPLGAKPYVGGFPEALEAPLGPELVGWVIILGWNMRCARRWNCPSRYLSMVFAFERQTLYPEFESENHVVKRPPVSVL
jgi:hypothetical protein